MDGPSAARPGRVLGLDLGERRIGVSLSDPGRRLASPHGVLQRSGDPVADRRRLAELVGELEAVQVVVGLPLSLDGSRGPAARAVIEEVAALAAHIGVPVSTFDERLSTLEAQRRRRLADEPAPARGDRSSAPGRRRPAGARRRARAPLDAVAAAIILQAWLDAGPGSSAATP